LKENKNENDIDNGNKNDIVRIDKNNEIKKEDIDKVNIKNNNHNKLNVDNKKGNNKNNNNNNNVNVDDKKGKNKNEKINMINENKNDIKRDNKENEENEKNEKEKNKNNNLIISNIKINNNIKKNKKNIRYENNINVKTENNKLNVNNGTNIENKIIENKKEQKIKIKINKTSENKKNEIKEDEAKKIENNENNKHENDDKKDNKNYNKNNNNFSINMLLNEKKKKNILKKNYNIEIENSDKKKSLKENKLINSQDINFSKRNKINHFFIACDSKKNSSNDNLVVSRFRNSNNNKIGTSNENQISPNKYQNLFLRANYLNSNLKSNKIKKTKNTAEIKVKINKRNKEFDFNDEIIKNWGNKEELELMKQYLSYESKSSSKKKDIHNLKNKPKNNVPVISNFDDLIKKNEGNNNTNNKEDLKTYSSFTKRSIFKKRNKPDALFEREQQKILNGNKRNKSTNHINRKIIKNNKDFIFAKNINYNQKRKSLIKFTKLI
jgi:hypothetical protein